MTLEHTNRKTALTVAKTVGEAQAQAQAQAQRKDSFRRRAEATAAQFVVEACECMTTEGLPQAVYEYGLNAARLLALCRELHTMNHEYGRIGFFVAYRHASNVLDFKPPLRVWRFLTGYFPRRGWLKVLSSGDSILANCYAYTGSGSPGQRPLT